MVAEYITVRQLKDKFDLERTEDEQFFREWQDDLPELTDLEQQLLDEVKGGVVKTRWSSPNPKGPGYMNKARLRGLECITRYT